MSEKLVQSATEGESQREVYQHPAYTGLPNALPIQMLAALPSRLEYTGEFGLEIIVFLPFITWAAEAGLLKEREVVTYRGMAPFYKGLAIGSYAEKDEPRIYVEAKNRPYYLPVKDEHSWDWLESSPFHAMRDYRRMFSRLNIDLPRQLTEKPILIIHNKFNDEWGRGPVNFIPVDVLDDLCRTLKDEFSIVYIRHQASNLDDGYSKDHNSFMYLNDEEVINQFQDVFLFDDIYSPFKSKFSVNEFKNYLYSKSYYFISSQGGGAHHCAVYSGSILALNHTWGPEIKKSYSEGFYSFLSNPAPIRLVCLHPNQLIDAAMAMKGSTIICGQVHLRTDAAPIVNMLSPQAQREQYQIGLLTTKPRGS